MYRTLILKFDARVLVLVGALLAMIAVALPWTNFPSFLVGDLARGGVTGGRWLTLSLSALAALSLLLPWHPLRRVSLPAVCLAALCNLVALLAFAWVIQVSSTLEVSLGAQLSSVGSGLYLTFVGVVLMLVGGLMSVMPTVPTASAAASATPARRWLGYAGWLALVAVLAVSCVCAWGLGLVVRPYMLAAPGQVRAVPTFVPAPTAYLATPLVDVHLAPLSGAPAAPTSPTISSHRTATPATATSLATEPSIFPSPTTRRATPTLPSPTLPVIGGPTTTPPISPLETPTRTATPTITASPTMTGTATITPTSTITATSTITPSLFSQ